jgi:zinc protease
MKPLLAMMASALIGGLAAPQAQAQTIRASVVDCHLRVLQNGLKVYSVVDHRTTDVALQVWYGVGGKDDPPGRSGFAHLFEHLMFKGARDLPPEAMGRLTDDVGGSNNAETDSDYTQYEELAPAGHLERLLWAEAERMSSLEISQADFASERSVVEEELRQRVLSDPYGRLYAFDIPSSALTAQPYRRSPIGSIADLEQASLAEAKAFHALYYRPDNASLVVVGDFDRARLDAWIDKYFGPIARPVAPIPRVNAAEPPRTTARVVDAYGPSAPRAAVALTFVGPPAGSPDAAALDVLDAVLSEGKTSRLYDRLVYRRPAAAQIFSDVDLHQQAGVIDVGAILASGETIAQGEAELRAQLADLRDHPISDAELAAARNQLLATVLEDRETIDGLASEIGEDAVVDGDAGRINSDIPALQAVTAADVQRVARAWLLDERRATVRYHAAGWSGGRDTEEAASDPPVPEPSVGPADRTSVHAQMTGAPPAPDAAPAAITPTPAEKTLANGLRVIVVRIGAAPLATAVLTFRGGSNLDPADKAGLTAITASLAAQGANGRSAVGIARSLEGLGERLSPAADYDSSTFEVTGLSRSLPDALPILADIVRAPSFDKAELARLRRQMVAELSLSLQAPDTLSDFAVAPLVFGRGAYGHALSGLPHSVVRITRADVLAQHARLYRPDNAVLVLTGDVEPRAAFAMADRAFGDWVKPAEPLPAPPSSSAGSLSPSGGVIAIDLPGSDEAIVTLARRSVGRLDPDYYATQVANSVLGGGYAARLNTEIESSGA